MIVRPAVAGDAPGISDILNHYIRETTISFKPFEYTLDETEALIDGAHGIFVAEEEGRIVGYASYGQFRNGPGYARTMEHSILMAPGTTTQGGGRALMAMLEDHARVAGVGSLWAGVSAENPGGVSFHKRIGFEIIGTLPQVGYKFDRWIDLILMRKWLDPEGDEAGRTD